jgi:hypothetical protein
MKKQTLFLFIATLALTCCITQAQPGRPAVSPGFNSIITKLFGDNPTFSADIEVQMNTAGQQPTSMPGKITFDTGKSRYEMNISEAKGGQLNPGLAEHMKAMGMDRTVVISRPDTKTVYKIYPGLSAYVEMPLRDPEATKPDSAFKNDLTEIGKETINGHPCIKYKAVITDDQGQSHEFTVWKAQDLKQFPVKIEMNEQGHTTAMLYTNIKFGKPDAALFEAPKDDKKYDSERTLMQEEMMKRMGAQKMPGHP